MDAEQPAGDAAELVAGAARRFRTCRSRSRAFALGPPLLLLLPRQLGILPVHDLLDGLRTAGGRHLETALAAGKSDQRRCRRGRQPLHCRAFPPAVRERVDGLLVAQRFIFIPGARGAPDDASRSGPTTMTTASIIRFLLYLALGECLRWSRSATDTAIASVSSVFRPALPVAPPSPS